MVYCIKVYIMSTTNFTGFSGLSNRHIPKQAFGLETKWDNREGFLGYVFGIWLSGSPLKGFI